MLTPAATQARTASWPECVKVPSPSCWKMCRVGEKPAKPIQGTPSEPIGTTASLGFEVSRGSKYDMPWHPTPAPTTAPSGSTVDRLCGHPLQYAAARLTSCSGNGWRLAATSVGSTTSRRVRSCAASNDTSRLDVNSPDDGTI